MYACMWNLQTEGSRRWLFPGDQQNDKLWHPFVSPLVVHYISLEEDTGGFPLSVGARWHVYFKVGMGEIFNLQFIPLFSAPPRPLSYHSCTQNHTCCKDGFPSPRWPPPRMLQTAVSSTIKKYIYINFYLLLSSRNLSLLSVKVTLWIVLLLFLFKFLYYYLMRFPERRE